MPFAKVNGIDIWYEVSSPSREDAPFLAMTHGFAGPNWPPIVDEFRSRFRMLDYHVRGHGRTTVPENEDAYSLPLFAADLAGLLDVVGVEQAHIAGVSMGGMISAQFACDFPWRVRSLVLCDTTAGNGAGEGPAADAEVQLVPLFEQMARIVQKYGLAGLVERENRYRREQDPHAAMSSASLDEQDAKNAGKLVEMTDRGFLLVNRALRERPDLTSRTPGITAPTLVSCGEWDMWHPCAQREHRLIASSRLATIRGAAHATPDYQPELWKRAVFDFIEDVEEGRDVRGEVEYAPQPAAHTP